MTRFLPCVFVTLQREDINHIRYTLIPETYSGPRQIVKNSCAFCVFLLMEAFLKHGIADIAHTLKSVSFDAASINDMKNRLWCHNNKVREDQYGEPAGAKDWHTLWW